MQYIIANSCFIIKLKVIDKKKVIEAIEIQRGNVSGWEGGRVFVRICRSIISDSDAQLSPNQPLTCLRVPNFNFRAEIFAPFP